MNSELTAELIWHFAGHLHLSQDFVAYRVRYEDGVVHARIGDFTEHASPEAVSQADLPELRSQPTKTSYSARPDHPGAGHDLAHAETDLPDAEAAVSSFTKLFEPEDLEFQAEIVSAASVIHRTIVKRGGDHPESLETEEPREPVYTIDYAEGGDDTIALVTQQNMASDRDVFSDQQDASPVGSIPVAEAMAEMVEKAQELIPDLQPSAGASLEFWTPAILQRHADLVRGDAAPETIAAGRYVNGERAGDAQPALSKIVFDPPPVPERPVGDYDPGQVAQLGANEAQNLAVIADLNEAPSTLIVGGDYFETNAIFQANVLKDRDHVLTSGSGPDDGEARANRTDNIANFASTDLAKNSALKAVGDLRVKVEVVDGDLVDTKTLTQRNVLDDGDVSVQTRVDSYSQVITGGNGQYSAVKFEDWGKHYDIVIVAGDYHSANIISQTNILLDSDIVAIGSAIGQDGMCGGDSGHHQEPGGAGGASAWGGLNALHNEASITQFGATGFSELTGDLEALLGGLSRQETMDREAWSSFHGAASGSLNVLYVTGNYYDLNIISQVNVIADADLALQTNPYSAGGGTQWLSTGANLLANQAAILDAGGLYRQYLGGESYEESLLVQANLVSESSHVANVHPAALVSEVVAFMDLPQDVHTPEGETWAWSTYSNHDAFGNVMS